MVPILSSSSTPLVTRWGPKTRNEHRVITPRDEEGNGSAEDREHANGHQDADQDPPDGVVVSTVKLLKVLGRVRDESRVTELLVAGTPWRPNVDDGTRFREAVLEAI